LLRDPSITAASMQTTPAQRDDPAWTYFQLGVQWSGNATKSLNWYDSVIQYMEKAVAFDPDYADRVAPYLNKAYAAKKKHRS
jgi:hypothetical protein